MQQTNTNTKETHDPQIEIDGKHVYKATAVKSLFSANPLSKDRLRRVRGLSKFTDVGEDTPSDLSIDSSVMVGDPLLVNVKGTLELCKSN